MQKHFYLLISSPCMWTILFLARWKAIIFTSKNYNKKNENLRKQSEDQKINVIFP